MGREIGHDGFVATGGDEVRDALVRQWHAIAAAVPHVDLEAPSRVGGWRNREVVAHLSVQPVLLLRFLATASHQPPMVTLAANLSGTRAFAELIDVSARAGAKLETIDFGAALTEALPELVAADLAATVVTLQGPIRLVDYLVTRCIEAVVHGGDLVEPVDPDVVAQTIAATALLAVLSGSAPHLVQQARELPLPVWIDIATGRRPASGALATAVPVMT
jgi:hypothetical protein